MAIREEKEIKAIQIGKKRSKSLFATQMMLYSFVVVHLLSCVWCFVTPWTVACQAPLSPTVCSNSCPLSQRCYLIISSSANPLSFCLQIFPTSGSFPMSQLLASGGQSIRASASSTVLPMNIQGWFPVGVTGFDILAVQGTLKSLLQHHNSKAPILWLSAFFRVQLSHLYMTTRKTIALTIRTFVCKVMSLLFNTVTRFFIAFLPRSKQASFNFMAAVTICSDFGAQENKICHYFHFFPLTCSLEEKL